MDEISAVKPPITTAAALAPEQTVEQKRVSMESKIPSDNNPDVESFDVAEDSNSPPKIRSRLRTFSILLMLCVRVSPCILIEHQLTNDAAPSSSFYSSQRSTKPSFRQPSRP